MIDIPELEVAEEAQMNHLWGNIAMYKKVDHNRML